MWRLGCCADASAPWPPRGAVSAEETGAVTAKRPHKDRSAAIAGKSGTLGTSRSSFLRDSALGLYAA